MDRHVIPAIFKNPAFGASIAFRFLSGQENAVYFILVNWLSPKSNNKRNSSIGNPCCS